MIMCIDIAHILIDENLWENCSYFLLKWFLLHPFGEMCFSEESYKYMQKIQIFNSNGFEIFNFYTQYYKLSELGKFAKFNVNIWKIQWKFKDRQNVSYPPANFEITLYMKSGTMPLILSQDLSVTDWLVP